MKKVLSLTVVLMLSSLSYAGGLIKSCEELKVSGDDCSFVEALNPRITKAIQDHEAVVIVKELDICDHHLRYINFKDSDGSEVNLTSPAGAVEDYVDSFQKAPYVQVEENLI